MRVGIRGQAPAGPIASRIHRHRRRGARIQRHAVQVDTGGPGGYRRVPFIVPFRSRRARRASLASHSFAKRACELTAPARATSGRPGKTITRSQDPRQRTQGLLLRHPKADADAGPVPQPRGPNQHIASGIAQMLCMFTRSPTPKEYQEGHQPGGHRRALVVCLQLRFYGRCRLQNSITAELGHRDLLILGRRLHHIVLLQR